MDKIIIPGRIYRKFIQSHPEYIFIYGCDYFNKSFFGQSNHAFGEPNAFGVPTIYKICASGIHFFDDGMFDFFKGIIDERIGKIPTGEKPIIPFPKIGCGYSEMDRKAPKLYNYLKSKIDTIKYPNIEYDYNFQ